MKPGKVEIADVLLAFDPIALPGGDLRAALQALWKGGDAWMLGHAFDGVLWGVLRDEALLTPAPELRPPALRAETLLDLKVFNADRELRVWRVEDHLAACLVHEAATGDRFEATQERMYQLLRAHGAPPDRGAFVELRGPAGQRHTPPGDRMQPERLRVRHYLRAAPETGLLTMGEHRLLGVEGKDWSP
jgi:hypothetical protein